MTAALAAHSLSKTFNGRPVFADVSLSVAPGEFVVILGPSGSGKTTLFRCLTRLTDPDAGSVLVGGRDITHETGMELAKARRDIGLVFQQFNLVRRLSALDNVLAGRLAAASLWRVITRQFSDADKMIAYRALLAVGLGPQLYQRADTLSGGQQQRVAIARALAQQSRTILADEPVASLDPETAVSILELLKGIARSRGLAVLCTLHQPALADRFADRVLVMRADGGLQSEHQHSVAITPPRLPQT